VRPTIIANQNPARLKQDFLFRQEYADRSFHLGINLDEAFRRAQDHDLTPQAGHAFRYGGLPFCT
jgi:hypothetical protein